MFVIKKRNDGYYFHQKGKIILFENPQEAEMLLQNFHQYSLQKLVEERDPEGIFELQNVFSVLYIVEENFEEIPPCGVVYFHELTN